MTYTGKKKPELQAEAKKRGLPTSGTVEELVTRLEADDQSKAEQPADDEPDLTALGDEPEQPVEPPAVENQAGPASDVDTSGAATSAELSGVDGEEGHVGAPVRDRGVFRAEFQVPGGELSDGVHQDYRRQTTEQAKAAGHRVVEGTAGARLLGIEDRTDGQYAIYEIHTRQAF